LKKSWTQDKWIKAGLKRAKGLWESYKGKYTPLEAEVATEGEPSLWEQYKRHIDAVPADDDFTAFINAPPTRLAQGTTALAWWSSSDQREAEMRPISAILNGGPVHWLRNQCNALVGSYQSV
jgi:hypothetical protein